MSSRYRMADGMVVDTDNAVESWAEACEFDGSNQISRVTGSQFEHQMLHQTRRGRYWLESWSQWEGRQPHAEWVDNHEAARWLLMCDHELPDDLAELADEVME